MKTTIKSISTITLAIAISYSSAFACGDMTNGNRNCLHSGGAINENKPTIERTKSDNTGVKDNDDERDSILERVQDFLMNFFG